MKKLFTILGKALEYVILSAILVGTVIGLFLKNTGIALWGAVRNTVNDAKQAIHKILLKRKAHKLGVKIIVNPDYQAQEI